ncbi:MAG: 50S ribosomal protein L15 [Phycisphaerales bacterium]|nr:50S ribosomal protein L15 [Phycisphaerales bacterium]
MMIHDITKLAGKFKDRKRVGRGTGSGTGRRSARGQKGASSRSGHASKTAFEGGQMPYFRRLRKFGFSNFNFTTRYWIVNIRAIIAHPLFAKGGVVNTDRLIEAGLIRDTSRDLKILGDLPKDEKLTVKLDVTANRVSSKARKLIEGIGGKVNETGTRRDKVRGIDRNSDDKKPKNLTKKLKRGSGAKKAPIGDEAEPAADAKPAKGKKEAAPRAEKPAADKAADKSGDKK